MAPSSIGTIIFIACSLLMLLCCGMGSEVGKQQQRLGSDGSNTMEATAKATAIDGSISAGAKRNLQQVVQHIDVLDYITFIDTTALHYGNCATDRAVDAKYTGDTVCNERGAQCTVGWTTAGEELVYELNLTPATTTIDITVRLSSQRANRQISIHVDGTEVGRLDAPGQGFDAFVDATLQGISLVADDTHELKIVFIHGQINVCAISVTSTSEPVPTPAPMPPGNNDAFRIKMYHEPGYFWQCDTTCNTSDLSMDIDPRWCLQCDNFPSCVAGDFARVRTCDDAMTNQNSLFEFVPTSMNGQVKIRNLNTNTCLTTSNYKDDKMNTKMGTCVDGNMNQIWWTAGYGSFGDGQPFEIHPWDDSRQYCLTTHHHPKDGEDVRVERCGLARKDKSNFFVTYYP